MYVYMYQSRCNSAQYIFFISLQIYSTCFGCHLHLSSGIQEAAVVGHWCKSYATMRWTVWLVIHYRVFIYRSITHFTMVKFNLTMLKYVIKL
jgi:hypothetical protein